MHSSDTVHVYFKDTGSDSIEPAGGTTLTRDGTTWYYLGGRLDKTGDDDADVWVNAAQDVSPVDASAIGDCGNADSAYFCDNSITSSWGNFNGKVQTIRISKTYRSDSWMKAQYYSLFDNLGAWGSEEQESGEDTTITESLGVLDWDWDVKGLADDVLSMTEPLGFAGDWDWSAHSLSEKYIGNITKLVDAEGSRPKILTAAGEKPGIASASGARPRLSAAEAFEYQERD